MARSLPGRGVSGFFQSEEGAFFASSKVSRISVLKSCFRRLVNRHLAPSETLRASPLKSRFLRLPNRVFAPSETFRKACLKSNLPFGPFGEAGAELDSVCEVDATVVSGAESEGSGGGTGFAEGSGGGTGDGEGRGGLWRISGAGCSFGGCSVLGLMLMSVPIDGWFRGPAVCSGANLLPQSASDFGRGFNAVFTRLSGERGAEGV